MCANRIGGNPSWWCFVACRWGRSRSAPFASTSAFFGLSKLSVWWLRLGIAIERIRPGHPRQNGRHDGFAIPVDLVQTVAAILKTKARVSRAWLGLWTGPPRQGEGARVLAVEREGPADQAGIEPGDVIVRVGERQVQRPQDVTSVVIGGEPGEKVAIDFVRNGKRATVAVQLAPMPTQQVTP